MSKQDNMFPRNSWSTNEVTERGDEALVVDLDDTCGESHGTHNFILFLVAEGSVMIFCDLDELFTVSLGIK